MTTAMNTTAMSKIIVFVSMLFVFTHLKKTDFASLYPSIIIEWNLCWSTFVPEFPDTSDPQLLEVKIGPGKTYYFHQGRPGVLPSILRSVLAERKAVKRQMKQETGMMKAILNAKQMALKVVANGSYGYCGRKSGEMLCPAISETTTYFGRRLIDMTIEAVETEFKDEGEVIYGGACVGVFFCADRQNMPKRKRKRTPPRSPPRPPPMPSVSPAGKRRRGPAGVIGRRLFWEEFMWLQDIFLDEEDFVTTTPLYNDISSPPPDA